MLNLFLLPGTLACSMLRLEPGTDHYVLFRTFTNLLVWTLITVSIVFSYVDFEKAL